MPWLRLDDEYDTHPKILALTLPQRWTWLRAKLWVARYEMRGALPTYANEAVPGLVKLRPKLRNLGLLDVDENGIDNVHDWDLYNGRDESEREAARQRQAEKRKRDKQRDGGRDVTRDVTRDTQRDLAGGRHRARSPSPTTLSSPRDVREDPAAAEKTSRANGPAAAAADLEQRLRALRVGDELLRQALAEPDRANACLAIATLEGETNPAGLFRSLLASGDWPSARQPLAAAKPEHRCPTCGVARRTAAALEEHLRLVHDAEPEPEPASDQEPEPEP